MVLLNHTTLLKGGGDMKQLQTKGFWLCAAVCVGGCLACISDGPVIIVDFVSGGTALTTGSKA